MSLPPEQAAARAELLAAVPVDLPLSLVFRSLPRRAKEALVVCTLAAAALSAVAVAQATGPGGLLASAVVATAAYFVYFAGAKLGHVHRWRSLRKKLSKDPSTVPDLVGFAAPSALAAPTRARVALVQSLRLHDLPTAAVDEVRRQLAVPAWWTSARPEARPLFFDGSRIHREGPFVPSGVLLEVVVDDPTVASRIVPGEPVRVIGDEHDAVLLTSSGLVWPRGSWLAGG